MKPHFPYTQAKTVRGKVRWFYRITWTVEGKRKERYVALPDDPDTPEFAAAYWKIRSGKATIDKPVATSWRNLIVSYRTSRRFRELALGTRKIYNKVIDDLLEKNADKDVTKVTRQQVRAIHEKYSDTPRAADHKLQVMSILFNFARKQLDWPIQNPAEGIELYGPQKEMLPWPEWLQKAWVKACVELDAPRALLAYHLGTGTGQRPGDLVKMEWAHFDGEFMQVVQEKTDARIEVYCPKRLRDFLATVPRAGRYVFAKNLTQPVTYYALEAEVRKVRTALGDKAKPYSMHGWRYVAAVELAEAGCSDAEIQSVTGHKALQMVQKYRSKAAQKGLSKQAQQRRESQGTNKG